MRLPGTLCRTKKECGGLHHHPATRPAASSSRPEKKILPQAARDHDHLPARIALLQAADLRDVRQPDQSRPARLLRHQWLRRGPPRPFFGKGPLPALDLAECAPPRRAPSSPPNRLKPLPPSRPRHGTPANIVPRFHGRKPAPSPTAEATRAKSRTHPPSHHPTSGRPRKPPYFVDLVPRAARPAPSATTSTTSPLRIYTSLEPRAPARRPLKP